jgi:hypothetical protein
MIILSDREPCCSAGLDQMAKDSADNAKASGAELFSVCITTQCDAFLLKEMVSDDVDDHFLEVDDTSKLNEYVQDLVDLLCPGKVHIKLHAAAIPLTRILFSPDPCFETPAQKSRCDHF